ncbi:MAG: phosphopyruvate hydratase [Verrucomicrobiae bacterium]|nr:phosphopyruvate hydratase [Verrucomicrobiae bacterium]
MPTLSHLDALEILDSRGRPTLEVLCQFDSGARASAQVPSGASTGTAEARELRDADPHRHAGLGCLRAVAHVTGPIRDALLHQSFESQSQLDTTLLRLDGTPSLERLGANAVLGVSLAFARTHAAERGLPLHRHFSGLLPHTASPPRLPRPTINLFSGGKHAGGQIAIQDVLLVPLAAHTMADALAHACAVFQAAARLVSERYRSRTLVADEGGLAPDFPSTETMLDDAVEAIRRTGLVPGRDIALAVDVASSHFYHDHRYHLDGAALDSSAMIDRLAAWVERFPIVSLEDGLAEDDWDHWPLLLQRLGENCLILGDDLLCTHPERIRRAVASHAANALLLKVNQIGTLSEAARALELARAASWHVTISARSGETEDHWLSDLATGWNGDHIKIGSITRSERLSKYNRLLAIEHETAWPLAPAP